MKTTIPIIILTAAILTGCGENKKDRAQRESEELDRRTCSNTSAKKTSNAKPTGIKELSRPSSKASTSSLAKNWSADL